MTYLVDAIVVALILYAAYSGSKRGMILLGLELVSFALATVAAFALYQPLGAVLRGPLRISEGLGNVSGFVIIWMVMEIISALVVRYLVLPRLNRQLHLSRFNRIGGGVAGAFKSAALILLALIVFAAVPLPDSIKKTVYQAFVPQTMLAAGAPVQRFYNQSLAHDVIGSFDFFTVPAEPESDSRVELGYTTTKVKVDPAAEAAMLEMLNHERTSRGLKPLTANPKARDVARAYSTEMFARGYFSHVTPEGKTPFDRMKAGGVTYSSAGENLALAPTLPQAHDGLMKSPGHRANILSPEYRTVGIGVIDGGQYGLMITQDFTD